MKFFSHNPLFKVKLACFFLLAFTLFACNKDEEYFNLPIYGPTQVFYALSDQNVLTTYNAKDVRTATNKVNITGLITAETLLTIDFRPATGELYGLSNLSKLYIIDIITGVAKAVSTTALTPLLSGTTVSMDFNATNDRIRVVTNTGQNLRVNPETGTVEATDTNLTNTSISAIAYTNSYAGATSSVLYDIDAAANKLYKQDPQNTGTLVDVGSFELTLGSGASFDISPDNNKILAVGKDGDDTQLFTIALSNGKATLAGKFVLGTNIRAIAIPANPVAYAVDNSNNLLIFNPTIAPAVLSKPITGLQTGETIYGIDMRPLNGSLYALGSSNRLYTINLGTGGVTQVGTGTLSTALAGTSFGFDFNPLTDAVRVVSNTGQNLRINPNTAAVTVDPNIPVTATLSAAAFSNNFRSASSTALYVVDHTTDKLYIQDTNTGVLKEQGSLKIDITATNGFDILYSSGDIAYGIFTVGTKTSIYNLDLSSGEAKATFEFAKPVTAFALGLKFN